VIAEFATLREAEAAGTDADAILSAPGGRRTKSDHESDDEAMLDPLTPREVQVLELLAEGLANNTIAERLAISDQTVKFHVASIYGKLGAANRTDAVRRAVRRGMITL
jgi:DNA-binding NarL/FixJ family response regulator